MGTKIDCCLFISFFGMIFYMSMGFIILGQPQFLKFVCHDNAKSIGACFITCFIFILFFIVMIILQRKDQSSSIDRVNYTGFETERNREQSFMGVQMGDLKFQQVHEE